MFCGKSEQLFIATLLFLLLVFSKISYLLEGGSMAHEDFCGHVGQLDPGDLQVWPRLRNRWRFNGLWACGLDLTHCQHTHFFLLLSYFLTSPFYGSSSQPGNLHRSLILLSHTSLNPLNHFLAPIWSFSRVMKTDSLSFCFSAFKFHVHWNTMSPISEVIIPPSMSMIPENSCHRVWTYKTSQDDPSVSWRLLILIHLR